MINIILKVKFLTEVLRNLKFLDLSQYLTSIKSSMTSSFVNLTMNIEYEIDEL